MATLEQRMRSLEKSFGYQPGRLIVMKGYKGTTDEEIGAELNCHGITRSGADDLVVFITIYETEDDGTLDDDQPPQLLSWHPLRKGNRT